MSYNYDFRIFNENCVHTCEWIDKNASREWYTMSFKTTDNILFLLAEYTGFFLAILIIKCMRYTYVYIYVIFSHPIQN